MAEPLLVIYSHSEYIEILNISTKFLKSYKNKILLIDNNFKNDEYLNYYNNIIYYDNKEPYGSRLLKLNVIKDDIILFMHETDVLIEYDVNILNNLKQYIINNKVDKIELQHCAWPPAKIPLKQTYNTKNKEIYFNELCNIYKIDNPNFFVYNVNPTLWRKESFLNIMNNFKHYNYREMESNPVQIYTASNFNCFSLKCDKYVKCAHFTCPLFFQFIHITHYGKFAQLKNKFYDNKNFKHLNNTYLLDEKIYNIYIKEIYEPYIINSKRPKLKSFPL
jgi:hypothetical protein